MKKQRCPDCNKMVLDHPEEWRWVRRAGSTIHRKLCKKCAEEADKEKGTLIVSD